MPQNLKRLALLFTLAALVQPALAQEGHGPALKVGDKAPKLALGTWFKGEVVTEFKEGEIYIIECWATWCGPCITAIPHVTELQEKYAKQNVTVIGVCVWDGVDDEKVKAFVDKQGDKMGYRVVREHRDDPSQRAGTMAETWLKAAGRNGIPCSFIVDKQGAIAWIGHPMRMDRPLAQIVAGTFDAKKDAEQEAAYNAAQTKYGQAMRAQDWDKALESLDELAKLRPDDAPFIEVGKLTVLTQKGDAEAVNKLASKLIEGAKSADDARQLSRVASALSSPSKARNPELAMKAAQRAVELTESKDALALNTLASLHAKAGEKDKAIELLTKAVAVADADNIRAYLERELQKLKSQQE